MNSVAKVTRAANARVRRRAVDMREKVMGDWFVKMGLSYDLLPMTHDQLLARRGVDNRSRGWF